VAVLVGGNLSGALGRCFGSGWTLHVAAGSVLFIFWKSVLWKD
jgi:hypothetical protein